MDEHQNGLERFFLTPGTPPGMKNNAPGPRNSSKRNRVEKHTQTRWEFMDVCAFVQLGGNMPMMTLGISTGIWKRPKNRVSDPI